MNPGRYRKYESKILREWDIGQLVDVLFIVLEQSQNLRFIVNISMLFFIEIKAKSYIYVKNRLITKNYKGKLEEAYDVYSSTI